MPVYPPARILSRCRCQFCQRQRNAATLMAELGNRKHDPTRHQ